MIHRGTCRDCCLVILLTGHDWLCLSLTVNRDSGFASRYTCHLLLHTYIMVRPESLQVKHKDGWLTVYLDIPRRLITRGSHHSSEPGVRVGDFDLIIDDCTNLRTLNKQQASAVCTHSKNDTQMKNFARRNWFLLIVMGITARDLLPLFHIKDLHSVPQLSELHEQLSCLHTDNEDLQTNICSCEADPTPGLTSASSHANKKSSSQFVCWAGSKRLLIWVFECISKF